jgi:hypothetical protein
MKAKNADRAASPIQPGIAPLRAEAIQLQRYLENQLLRVAATAPGTANVTVTVTKFPAKPGPVQFRFSLEGGNDRVTGNTPVNPTALRVSPGGPVNLRFTIVAADDRRDLYYPVGIAIHLKKAGPGTQGAPPFNNLPAQAMHLSGTSLFYTDAYENESYGNSYEYDLYIQSLLNGVVGTIQLIVVHWPPLPPPN